VLCSCFRLLDVDGLNENWEKGVRSDWEGSLRTHAADDEDDEDNYSKIMLRMSDSQCSIPRGNVDSSTVGSPEGGAPGFEEPATRNAGATGGGGGAGGTGVRRVRNMGMRVFRRKLIEHFDILWNKRQVEWPSRTGKVQMGRNGLRHSEI